MTLEKDKEDPSKYHLSYPASSVLDMQWENRDINFVEWANISKFPLLLNELMRLMECLTPTVSFDIFIDNYFKCFRLLTQLGVNNIRATRVFNKNKLSKCTIIEDKQLLKKERGQCLKSAHQAKKQCNFDSGWLERQQCDLHSFFWILWT